LLTGTEKLRGPWPALAALFVVAAALVLLVLALIALRRRRGTKLPGRADHPAR
jgi:uncharacterized membrane protein YecN with MAPEG domain